MSKSRLHATLAVEHRPLQHRFVVDLPEGEARLAYRMTSDSVMDMTSTFVPTAARGRGAAAALTEAALRYAREHQLQVVPTCWYVGDFIDAHREYEALLEPVKGRAPDRSASCDIS